MTTELERRLLANEPEQLALYLQSHAKPSLSEKFYPLLIRAQLDDWIREQTSHAMHSSALHSHVLTMLDWELAATAAADRASLTLSELFSMFRVASLCHDDRLQYDLEICLVELKRHLWLDRLVHRKALDELDAWLKALFPMAFPSAAGEQARTPAALAGLNSVWFHQPSVEAVAAEEEVAGELQSLLESGAEHEAVVDYCTKYPLRNFIQQTLQWLDAAFGQWTTKHGIAPTAAAAGTAAATAKPAAAKQTAQARAKAVSAAATAAAAASSASSVQAASAAKPAAACAHIAASSSSSPWRYDSLSINALEVESLLPVSLYATYPLDILSPDELEPSGNSSNSGSQEGRKESEAQRSERKALELRKAALLKAIHQQTHPEVVAFLRRELVAASAPAISAKTPRKSPAVLYTSFSELMTTVPPTPARAATTKKRAANTMEAAAASSVAAPDYAAAAAASASIAAASSSAAAASSAPAPSPAVAVASAPSSATAAAASPSPRPKRPRRAAASAAADAASNAAAAPMDLDAADAEADDSGEGLEGSEERKEEPRTQAQEVAERGDASEAAAKYRPAPYKPLTPAVGIKAFFKTAARPTAASAAAKRTK